MITFDMKAPDGPALWQPFKDLVAPAARSDWMRHVVHQRHFTYDRSRPFLTRLGLTVVLTVCYLALPAVSWWGWALLALPITQVVLEIYLEPKVREVKDGEGVGVDGPEPAGLDGAMMAIAFSSYETRWVNVTGLIGAVAVPVNLIAVAFATTAEETTGWVKVTAFLAAMLFANSGCNGPLLESTTYSERPHFGPVMRTLRWLAWPALMLLAALIVWVSDAVAHAWPVSAVPYAYLACATGYYLGLRTREHDRLAGAACLVADQSQRQAGGRIAHELHDLVQFHKGALDEVLERDDIDAGDRARLRVFLLNIEYIYAKAKSANGISVQDSLLPDARSVVRYICAAADITPDVSGITLPEPDETGDTTGARGPGFTRDNADYAKLVISTLTHNTVQAYGYRPDLTDRPVTVTAAVRDGDIVVTVSDDLPPIPEPSWLTPGSTLAKLQEELEHRQGTLSQLQNPTGKSIEARWRNEATPLLELDRQHHRTGVPQW